MISDMKLSSFTRSSRGPLGVVRDQGNETNAFDVSFAIAVVCIVLVAIDLRPGIVSIGPLLPQLREEFGLSNTQASLLTAIPTLLMGLLALPAPWLVRRYGLDRVVISALVILAFATAARAFVSSWSLLLVTTAGVGAGISLAGALIGGFVKQLYPQRVALLIGIYAMSLGLGSTIAAGATGAIASTAGGWRFGSGFWALPGLIAIAAWLVISRYRAPSEQSLPEGKKYRLPVNNPSAWLVAIYFASNNILFFGLLSWIAPMYREHGADEASAGLLLASFTGAFMVANLIPGLLSRNGDRRLLIGVFAFIASVGMIVTVLAPTSIPFLVIPLIAIGIGSSFTLGMTLPMDHASNHHEANVWNAFVLAIGYGTGALGPFLMGALRDMSGGFQAPMWFLVGTGILMLGLSPFLRPSRHT